MEASPEESNQWAIDMRKDNPHLLFTKLKGGNHRATWFIAYDMEEVQNRLFEQRRPSHEVASILQTI